MPFTADLADLAREWGRNPLEAFVALGEGLRLASRKLGRDEGHSADQHLSAEELVDGLIEVMVERCGLMATTVLTSWHLYSAVDIGALTFFLIEHGVLGKQAEDREEDFASIAPLAQLVERRFQLQLHASLAGAA